MLRKYLSDTFPTVEQCNRAARLTRIYRNNSSPEEEFEKRWESVEGDYCVYCLLEDSKHVRYIGITCRDLKTRLSQHWSDCGRFKNIYKENWLRKCRSEGTEVSIYPLKQGLTEFQACKIEEILIQLLKKPFNLTNTHAGGSTGYAGLSPESREKHRISMNSVSAQEFLSNDISDETDEIDESTECGIEDGFWPFKDPEWKKKLIKTIREKGLSFRTEQGYLRWARRFEEFFYDGNQADSFKRSIEVYLDSLLKFEKLSDSSRKQALKALMFLFKDAYGVYLQPIEFEKSECSAEKSYEVPSAGYQELGVLLEQLNHQCRVITLALFSTGLRIGEVLGLRIKNLDFDRKHIKVFRKNSEIDRVVPISAKMMAELQIYLGFVENLWEEDSKKLGFQGVLVPQNLKERNPNAGKDFENMWLFPSGRLSLDPRNGKEYRHIYSQATFRKNVRTALEVCGIGTRVSPKNMRRLFEIHMNEVGVDEYVLKTIMGV